jgi:uncharacterized protein (DUF697 family)
MDNTVPVVITPAQGEHISETVKLQAENCIKNHVIAAMGIGLIPSALVDVVGITGIEVKMIRDLAAVYKFPVPNKLVAYKVLISLIGSIGPVYFSTRMHAALKGVPLVGHAVYVGLLSLTGGAAVYAVGKIFQKHYESGGTFLSKDNTYIRDYFKEKYAEGKQVVKGYV